MVARSAALVLALPTLLPWLGSGVALTAIMIMAAADAAAPFLCPRFHYWFCWFCWLEEGTGTVGFSLNQKWQVDSLIGLSAP